MTSGSSSSKLYYCVSLFNYSPVYSSELNNYKISHGTDSEGWVNLCACVYVCICVYVRESVCMCECVSWCMF